MSDANNQRIALLAAPRVNQRVPTGIEGSGRAPLNGKGRLWRALSFAFPYRQAVVGICLITLVLAALNAAEPLILKYVFDSFESDTPLRGLWIGIGLMLGLAIFREGATGYSNWLTWHARLGIHYSLLEQTVERLHRMPL